MQRKAVFTSSLLNDISILGVVIAGGKSSRMGTDKASLSINGVSFLDAVKNRLNEVGIKNILVSSNHIEGALKDRVKHCGPLSALHALAHYTELHQYDMALICPVDMPLVNVQILQQLVAFSCETQNSCYFENHPLPLCLWLDRTFTETAEIQMKEQRFALRDLLLRLNADAICLPKNNEFLFSNINTPKEYEELKKIANGNV